VLGDFGEMTLNQRVDLVWAACGIAVTVVVIYATVKQLRLQKKLSKRMGLDDDPAAD
jgi:hypothetical protein